MEGFNEWLSENDDSLSGQISDMELHQLVSTHREATREDLSQLVYHLHRKIKNTEADAELRPVISKILGLGLRLSDRFEEIDRQLRLRLDQQEDD